MVHQIVVIPFVELGWYESHPVGCIRTIPIHKLGLPWFQGWCVCA